MNKVLVGCDDCSTDSGSSGAPIIDTQTLKIIGVHTRSGGGVHFLDYDIPF